MIEAALQQVMTRAAQLPPAGQQELAAQFEQVLDTFLQEEATHPVFTDEVAWMKHLGMDDESIARVMEEPLEPEPGEAYLDADA
jgi:hypothetical protein